MTVGVDIHRALPCSDCLRGDVCRAALSWFTRFFSLVGAACAAQAVQQWTNAIPSI